jgi:hypothetical protein
MSSLIIFMMTMTNAKVALVWIIAAMLEILNLYIFMKRQTSE